MASAVRAASKGSIVTMRKKRESLSVVPSKAPPTQERLDKTQGIQDSDYRIRSATAGPPDVIVRDKATGAVALDVFDYEQLENVEFLASGAFSHVFSAIYKGKNVVVKLLREQYKESQVTLKQMRFEQTLLSQLDHSNIVEFIGTGVYNGVPFTVLERLDETLNQRMGGEVRLTMLESLTYAMAIGEALVYLHDAAISGHVTLHRDLKPDNLAFGESGSVKLIDFGLARSVPRGASINEVYEMTGETGSLRYMAPEVALGMLYNAKADVYSLALITWQMVQGTKPFQGMSRKDFFHHVVHRHFRPPVDPKWPPALSSIIVQAWDPDQLKRPTAREFVDTLGSIVRGLSRHRRNSTGTSSSLSRVRNMFNMIKERAEDYVVGATGTVNGVHHDRRRSSACVGASGEKVGFKEGEEHRGQEEPQQKPQEETQPPSDAKENQKTTTLPPPIPEPERQPAAAPCQVLQPIPQDEEERTEMETPKEVAVGPPDAIGQIPGENDTGGHKRRNSY
ncbi:hypothetical protein NSK_000157 [Nannochloropsis salina CCMP1776]|uniref:Protein kinase domain-containing protein n=4 Tax=Nannochloropsis salina CCMP1776 TaxID=1027361 RepID=A0A4D9DDS7_9STRA|nr:hypothetical protein NSK_000157 [Nannochloropsis salina CCMP1776]|eukprot:TFJ88587.1 hypothetical protein NSK_000157 [Nannochloropsis salina CCMP1776]